MSEVHLAPDPGSEPGDPPLSHVDHSDEHVDSTEDPNIDDDFQENEELREILQSDESEKVCTYRCVLLDTTSTHLGIWNDAAQSVRLRLWLCSSFVQPRIEIGLTIKWHDGRVSHEKRPANPLYRMFGDQIAGLDALKIVSRKVGFHLTIFFFF